MYSDSDTIAAIATPLGEGGIAVIRIAGDNAGNIARAIFRATKDGEAPRFESHRIYHGRIYDPESGDALDDVLLFYFAPGKSYTGDETVEISCHGGPYVTRRILEAALASGARQAGPGEFTRRAFLAGRIDLAQAEAVADLIAASSARELINARRQLDGRLSDMVKEQADLLTEALAEIESRIDFAEEEDIGALPIKKLRELLEGAARELASLAATYRDGRVLREGYRVAIVGRTNVGKSSLLNRLLGADRAIVTAEPGTTRDVIEERVILRGVPFILADTAGLREILPENKSVSPGPEAIGIQRSLAELEARKSDPGGGLLLVVLDASEPLSDDDLKTLECASAAPHIIALNKCDLERKLDVSKLPEPFRGENIVSISALKGKGLTELIQALVERRTTAGGSAKSEGYLLANARHKAAVDRSIEAIRRALDILEKQPPEIVALEVRLAREALDEIVGAVLPEDVLDIIFSRFCIGK